MTGFPRPVTAVGTLPTDPLEPGEVTELSSLVRRVLAPNPSVMTGPGTNTYLVGEDEVTVIDPGPDDESHIGAILDAAAGRLQRIVCTHTHVDHWPAAVRLRASTGAEVIAYGSRDGLEVDATLGDGDEITTSEYRLQAIHTPGHASNHLCYLLADESLLFSGDHINQGTTVVIAPPDGDMNAYLDSLRRLAALDPPLKRIAPAHGHVITDPGAVIAAYLDHRLAREALVAGALATLSAGGTVDALVQVVYADVDPSLHPVARLSLWAHLRALVDSGRATSTDPDDLDSAVWATA